MQGVRAQAYFQSLACPQLSVADRWVVDQAEEWDPAVPGEVQAVWTADSWAVRKSLVAAVVWEVA